MRFIARIMRIPGRTGRRGGEGALPPAGPTSTTAKPEEKELLPGDHWHVTSASSANFLFNNVWMGQGWLPSMAGVRRDHGDRFITTGDLYPLMGKDTEEVWERVRAARFPHKPSRRGATFLFDRHDAATEFASKWMPDTDTVVLRSRISIHASVHTGHVGWLEASAGERKDAAARYWAGEPCPGRHEILEHVVDGLVYFPDWEMAPFGPFGTEANRLRSGHPVPPAEIVTCPACGIEFNASPPNSATLATADRARCIEDPDRPLLFDCPHVEMLIEAAWERMGGQDEPSGVGR